MKQLRYADLLQEKVDGNLTRNDEALLDVVVDQLGVLASTEGWVSSRTPYLAFSSRRQSPALMGIQPSFSFRVADTVPFPGVELRFLTHT